MPVTVRAIIRSWNLGVKGFGCFEVGFESDVEIALIEL